MTLVSVKAIIDPETGDVGEMFTFDDGSIDVVMLRPLPRPQDEVDQ